MPYRTNADLPSNQVARYAPHQKNAFREAFNAALKYGHTEASAFAIAHTAAQRTPRKKKVS